MKRVKQLLASAIMTLTVAHTVDAQVSMNMPTLNKVAIVQSDDFSDLAAFGEAIKDKQIIYLDELTHGEHEVFALKARLVKYLHQQQGFDVLLLESGLFDVNEIDKKSALSADTSIAEQAKGNIFFGYAKDPAFLALMDYIDHQRDSENALHLAGFDGRLSGEQSIKHFVQQLKNQVETLPNKQVFLSQWPSYSKQLQATLERKKQNLSDRAIEQHIVLSYQLMDALQAVDNQPNFDTPSYYARLLEGLVRLFEVQYDLRRFDEHDLVMANNIYWMLENIYTDKKVIVWGHYVHVNRQGYLTMRNHNVATALSQKYGEQSYFVNFAGVSGQFREFRDGSVQDLPALTKQHLAYHLQPQFTEQQPALFVEPSAFSADIYQDLVLYGHEYKARHQIAVPQWQNHFDSIFLLNKVTASN
ncbi:erythromycin esterase family protein [Catenovulum sp. SM1970]|uniref:erythromycin esterase family protein n=1 Tax=Marinifaba aquimaris TaxID=2741323 RepID=UPI001572000E|nr:erythromycin esterase family protein [Marinifaba aquimaris]NTS76329.1 erythromycin esterase family protein [Marinifaba aquimaris]